MTTALVPMSRTQLRLERERLAWDNAGKVASGIKDVTLAVLGNPALQMVGGCALVEMLQRVQLDKVPEEWETVLVRSPVGGWHHETVTRRVKTPLIGQDFATTLEAGLVSAGIAGALGGGSGIASLLKLFMK